MIHGLARSTTNAGAAVAYFLGGEYYDDESKEWRPREPAPVVLEGDPEAIQELCNSVAFKNQYTSGVLSFSPEETVKIAAAPGLKEAILEDFKNFAFAGVQDDCRQFLAVEHSHTGRLEVHYLIPRVHLESGKYYNPFPPNYDGKRGEGANYGFIEENDSYIDHACAKFGLQNPRAPEVARHIKIEKFDPEATSKKEVNKFVNDLVLSGHITCREDIARYLKEAGGTITRLGDDYISVKFADDQKAMRFKGGLYANETFGAAAVSARQFCKEGRGTAASSEEKFAEILARRTEEAERRHYSSSEKREQFNDFERAAESRFAECAEAVQGLKNSAANRDSINSDTAQFCRVHHAALVEHGEAAGSAISASSGIEAHTGSDIIATGIPYVDELARKLKQHIATQEKEAIARAKRLWSADSAETAKRIREAAEHLVKTLVGVFSGVNLVEPSRAFDRKALQEYALHAAELQQRAAQQIEDERSQRLQALQGKHRHQVWQRENSTRAQEKPYVPSWKRGEIEDDDGVTLG